MVLEKTLESPLDCKEIKPVNTKGNQPWIFIGRTNVEAEAPILWPPDVKRQRLKEQTQTHALWVSDAIQPSHSLLPTATLVSFCLQFFPASGSFPMSQIFASGGPSICASTLVLVLLKNIQGWFPLGLTDLTSSQFKELSRVFSGTTLWKHQFFGAQLSLWYNSTIHMWLLIKYLWLYRTLSAKWCLCFLICCLGLS